MVLLFCLVGASCRGEYQLTTICDYALLDGHLYLLVMREEGVDSTSRFSHSAAFRPTRRVLGLARAPIDGTSRGAIELVATEELFDTRFLDADMFLIASTNRCVVKTAAGAAEVISFSGRPDAAKGRTISADRITFSTSRKLLVGWGKAPSVLEAESLRPTADAASAEVMAMLSGLGTNTLRKHIAVSDELRTVVLQDEAANPPGVRVVLWGDSPRTNHFVLPDGAFTLQNVHGGAVVPRILFSGISVAGQSLAVILDGTGRELDRIDVPGIPVADSNCSIVVACSASQTLQLNQGDRLLVKVWLPDQKRETVLSLDTSGLLAGLASRPKR